MKYVKFISKPDEWFKEGTEAFYEDSKFKSRRMTVEEYERILNEPFNPSACFVGIRVCEDNPNENGMGCVPGEERIDGEWCSFDEFEIEFTDEYKEEYNR
jgi:hypothetical protein